MSEEGLIDSMNLLTLTTIQRGASFDSGMAKFVLGIDTLAKSIYDSSLNMTGGFHTTTQEFANVMIRVMQSFNLGIQDLINVSVQLEYLRQGIVDLDTGIDAIVTSRAGTKQAQEMVFETPLDDLFVGFIDSLDSGFEGLIDAYMDVRKEEKGTFHKAAAGASTGRKSGMGGFLDDFLEGFKTTGMPATNGLFGPQAATEGKFTLGSIGKGLMPKNLMGGGAAMMGGGIAALGPQMLALSLIMKPIGALLEGLLAPLEPIIDLFGMVGEILGLLLVPIVQALMEVLLPFMPLLVEIVMALMPLVRLMILPLIILGKLMGFLIPIITGLVSVIRMFIQGISDKIAELMQWFRDLFQPLTDALSGVGEGFRDWRDSDERFWN